MKQNLVLKYFTEICKIPHTSGNEEALAKYITSILKKAGCKITTDKLGNVHVSKNGKLKVPGICFQAHLDMVGEKNIDSHHDFKNHPIDFYEEHGWIKARGTTLGADNGVGIALILAIFTDKTVNHGPLEALFTVQEETTTIGAIKLKNDWIKSPYLINVDSENDNHIVIGSSNCCDFHGSLAIRRKPRENNTTDLSIKIMNGAGGHSASEIHLNRVNTIVEVFNILKTVSSKSNFQIIDVKTSSQLNAIPNYCEVIVNIDQHHVNQLKRMILTQFNNLYTAYSESDKHLSLVINAVKADKEPLILNDSNKLINLVTAANNSLNNFDVNFQTTTVSTNLGKLVTSNDEIQLSWLQRSNTEYDLDKLNNKLISLFTILNGSYKIINIAKGLKADLNNRLALQIQKLISTKFNRNVSLLNTHSVLEIGDIVRHYPTITAVSIGPNIEYPHTPRERVEIKSILYIYDLMKEIVKTIR